MDINIARQTNNNNTHTIKCNHFLSQYPSRTGFQLDLNCCAQVLVCLTTIIENGFDEKQKTLHILHKNTEAAKIFYISPTVRTWSKMINIALHIKFVLGLKINAKDYRFDNKNSQICIHISQFLIRSYNT